MDRTIEVKRKPTHYEIYVDGKFYSSCDFNELRDEIKANKNNDKILEEINEYHKLKSLLSKKLNRVL